MTPVGEHPHQGRIQAVAHLSDMYAKAECAIEALAEDGIFSPGEAIDDARHELVRAADEIVEPFGVANVLQTVEETIVNGNPVPDLGEPESIRFQIVMAIVDTADAAREDDPVVIPNDGREHDCLCGASGYRAWDGDGWLRRLVVTDAEGATVETCHRCDRELAAREDEQEAVVDA
jgi:hypothetical protein